MHIPTIYPKELTYISNNKIVLLIATLLSIVYPLIIASFYFNNKVLFFLVILPLVSLLIFNTEILIGLAITSLFFNHTVFIYWIVVFSTIPVAISYLVTYKSTGSKTIKSPILIPFLIYFLTMLPSFYNTVDIFKCFLWMFNLFSMVSMFCIIGDYIKSYQQIKRFLITFLLLSCLNGLSIINASIATGGERVFGFAGIVYVDFVNIAICIAITLMLFHKKNKSLPFLFLILFLFTSLLFTQTRSTILALIMTLGFLFLFLFKNNTKFSFSRIKLLKRSLIAVLFVILITIMLSLIFPNVFVRLTEFFSKNSIKPVIGSQLVFNSLISRVLVWHTSLNAFLNHPIIGIGAFSFSFDSIHYFKIPTELYKLFVQGLSPHLTYLAVLTETGVIGLIGFIIFLYTTLKMTYKSLKFSLTENQKYYSLGILLLQIYIAFSMCVTDAWLWGQCGMLWSIVLGISVANYKMIIKSNNLV